MSAYLIAAIVVIACDALCILTIPILLFKAFRKKKETSK